MSTVVADSGPLRYLVLIGEIELLPKLMGDVLIPSEVKLEIDRPQTPAWCAPGSHPHHPGWRCGRLRR